MKENDVRRKVSKLLYSVDIIIGVPKVEGTIGYETAFHNVRQGKKLAIMEQNKPYIIHAKCGEYEEEKRFVYADVIKLISKEGYYESFIKELKKDDIGDIIGIYYGG